MTDSRYKTVNLKPSTKEGFDALADDLGGIQRAAQDAVVQHLMEEAGYGDYLEDEENG